MQRIKSFTIICGFSEFRSINHKGHDVSRRKASRSVTNVY
jgi:hypothetical protein